MHEKMCGVHKIGAALVVVGAINWGLIGLLQWNLVEAVLGTGTVTRVVYILVGLAGIAMLGMCKCSGCKK